MALKLVNKLMGYALNGVGPLTSSEKLAQEYLLDKSYRSNLERINSLTRWEILKNFTSVFLTGLGGIITLPKGEEEGQIFDIDKK